MINRLSLWEELSDTYLVYLACGLTGERNAVTKTKGKSSLAGQTPDSYQSIHCPVFPVNSSSVCLLWKVNGANHLLVHWSWENRLRPLVDIVNDAGFGDMIHFSGAWLAITFRREQPT